MAIYANCNFIFVFLFPQEISEQKDHLSKSHSENGISVKEIVTEIESFNQGVGQCQQKTDNLSSQVQTPKRNTIHDLSLEAVWEPENGGKHQTCESGTALLHDKPKDPKCQEGKQSSEEDCENSNETSDQQDLPGQAPKWCAGSVRRATMEFEERLRQEQEQQHVTAVPVRKNSKNDAAVCDASTKSKFEDSSLDISDHERDKRVRIKITGFEAVDSLRSEPSTDSQSSLLFEPLSEQDKQDTSHSGLAGKPNGTGIEQSPTTTEILERTDESMHLPKRIELDHSIEIKSYDSNDNNISPQDSVIYTGEVAAESKMYHQMPLEPSLGNVCESTSDSSSAHIENLPLLIAPKSGPPNLSITVDSPKEELTVVDLNDPVTSPGVHSDLSSPSYLCHPCSIVLEGATEECTSTDEDLGNLSNCTDRYSSNLFMGVSELMQREADSALSQLSHEDLNLINKLTENIRELHEVLDVSALSFGLPHSSSSDSIKDSGSNPGVVKQRAKEIEARIRQAGLTTPSQMKRSASLAKLGCLELSKDDLSERESVSSDNQTYPDLLQSSLRIVPGNYELDLDSKSEDPPGKLCILSVQASTGVEPTQHFVEQIKTSECIVKSKPVEKPLVQYAKEFGTTQQGLLQSSESELTASQEHLHHLVELEPSVPLVTITPRHEHGRTHPLRRLKKTNEKKRTTNPLYNTM